MADEFCHRVDEKIHALGMSLHSRVHPMGRLALRVSRKEDDVRFARTITVDNFSQWTPEKFSEFEVIAVDELTR